MSRWPLVPRLGVLIESIEQTWVTEIAPGVLILTSGKEAAHLKPKCLLGVDAVEKDFEGRL